MTASAALPIDSESQSDVSLSSWTPLLLIVLVLCVFGSLLAAGFVEWDDPMTLTANVLLHPVRFHSFFRYWTWPADAIFMPLTGTIWCALAWVSSQLELDGSTNGLHPTLFHAANLLAHCAACVMVWLILRRLLLTIMRRREPASDERALVARANWCGAAGAMFWAVHPIQVEPVAWASGLKDVLAGLFSLATIWQYQLAIESADDSDKSRRHRVFAVVMMLLALGSKVSACVTPGILFLLDWLVWRRPVKTIVRDVLPIALCCLPAMFAAKLIQHPPGIPLLQRPLLVCYTISFYISKIFVPIGLVPDYARQPTMVLHSQYLGLCWIIPLVLAVLIWLLRATPLIIAGILIFLIAFLPNMGFIPFGTQDQSTVSDHYMYLPMFGVAIAFAAILAMIRPAQLRAAIAVAIIATLSIRSFVQARYWRNSVALFTHVVEVEPWSYRAEERLGVSYLYADLPAPAAEHLRKSLQLHETWYANSRLAMCRYKQHMLSDALRYTARALEIDPQMTEPRLMRARIFIDQRNPEAATQELAIARQNWGTNPDDGSIARLQAEVNRLRKR